MNTQLGRWFALGVLTLAVVMLAVDGTVLALAVPTMTADLGATATQILWIGDIYSFALAGLLVTMGNVADRIGRKKLLLIGATGFGIASVLAAFAPTAGMLIAARALLGIAGATIMPSTLALVRNLFDEPRQRTRAIAVWSAGATAGAAAGPLVGGVLLENFWWGSVFLINVPIIALVIVAGIFFLPESTNPERAQVDLTSALLSFAAIVPIVYGLKHFFGSGFDESVAIAVAAGGLAGIAFVGRQRRLPSPLIDLRLFSSKAFSGAVAASGIAIFAFVGLLFFFSQYLQLVRGLSPLQAGLVELPSAVASVAVITIAAWTLRRLGRGRAIGVGLLVSALGFGLLVIAEGRADLWALVAALAIVGLGAALASTLAVDAVVSAAPKSRAGAASSIAETAYELGVALGIAVLGSIHTVLYRSNLPTELTGTGLEQSLAAGIRDAAPEAITVAQHAFTIAMQYTSSIAAVLLALAASIAWCVIPSGRDADTEATVAHH